MVSKLDKKILELLQRDARMPITQIAREVNMSENGVKYRLDKLEEKGIIRRFALLIDPKKVGKEVMAMFDIQVEPEKLDSVIPQLAKLDEFIKMYHTTGERPITAIGFFESNEALTDFVNKRLLVDFPVTNCSVDIVTKQYKDSIFYI